MNLSCFWLFPCVNHKMHAGRQADEEERKTTRVCKNVRAKRKPQNVRSQCFFSSLLTSLYSVLNRPIGQIRVRTALLVASPGRTIPVQTLFVPLVAERISRRSRSRLLLVMPTNRLRNTQYSTTRPTPNRVAPPGAREETPNRANEKLRDKDEAEWWTAEKKCKDTCPFLPVGRHIIDSGPKGKDCSRF